jgi:7-cyano-7-deazaguanine synthase
MKQTVVPNRNSIMLSAAVGVAVAEKAEFVAAGMHAGDHFIYPDCRDAFVQAFNTTMRLANDGFWEGQVIAPFIGYSKANIVTLGDRLGVEWRETWSCYKGLSVHCGLCGTCNERKEAFELAGVYDPTEYHT